MAHNDNNSAQLEMIVRSSAGLRVVPVCACLQAAAIAYGYLSPFWLEGPCKERFYGIETGVCTPRPERTARYMAGVRVVASVTRGLDDPRAWSATIGVEFEPVATLRMLLVARSWY